MASHRSSYLRGEYLARINRVIDHVEANLDKDLSLEKLAAIANFSRFHFHRVFHAIVGETVMQFVKRVRVERAAQQLINHPRRDITTIALDCGFSGSATFARAFRDAFGMSATAWRSGGYRGYRKNRKVGRKNHQIESKASKAGRPHASYPTEERRQGMTSFVQTQVEVRDVPEMNVAYTRYIGPYPGKGEVFARLFDKLMTWAGPRGLITPNTKVLTVYHDDPEITDEEKLRIEACITVPEGTPVEGEIGQMKVPGGRYAVAHFELGESDYGDAWQFVYGEWLPSSGFQPDDRPGYELYHSNPDEHPEHKQIVDICIPVRPL